MLRLGKIQSIDQSSNSGTLIDTNGEEYFFNGSECRDSVIPALGAIVLFHKDRDYRQTNVACLIEVSTEVINAA